MKILIIGGGIVAAYIANRLVKERPEYEVTILSKEEYMPYDRIHLCSLINKSLNIEDLFLEIEDGVKVELNQEVKNIYTKSKIVITENSSFEYDKLIIATGSKPKTLFDTTGVKNASTFRSVDDCKKISKGIKNKNVVLLGVGPIGLELLDTLSKMSEPKYIYILSRGEHLYSKDMDISSIKLMKDIFEADSRVKILFNDQIVSKEIKDGNITTIKTKTQEIDEPFLIFGVGVAPNIDFARGSLETDKGILVNSCMKTSDENIYAAGEAAQTKKEDFIAGRVKECIHQADVVISSIFGHECFFEQEVSIDSLKIGSFLLADVTSSKYNLKEHNNENIVISSKKDNRVDQYIVNNNKLVKFIGVNTNIDLMHLKMLIENNEDVVASYFFDNRLTSERGRLVCSCTSVFELDLVDIIKENCIEEFPVLKEFSEAGRVCGRCKQDIVKIIKNTPVDPEEAKRIKEEKEAAKRAKEIEKVQKRIDKFNKLHPKNKVSTGNLEAAMKSFDMNKEYNKWISMITANLRLHPEYESFVSKSVKELNKIPIIWLELSDCTGNSEAFIKSSHPTVEELILDYVSLDYHELLMAGAGDDSESALDEVIKNDKGKYILIVEGAVPLAMEGKFLRIGPKGETGADLLKRCAKDAALVIGVGTCAFDGGVVAAGSNPTGAVGVSEALDRKDIINLPGCPTNPVNIVGTLLYYIMFDELPAIDSFNRPTWAYGYRLHDNCERRGHYDLDEFVEEWGDEGAKLGWCLYKMGCKGAHSNLNCSLVKFNEGTSWPVQSGHGCFACGEGKIAFNKYANQRELEDEEK